MPEPADDATRRRFVTPLTHVGFRISVIEGIEAGASIELDLGFSGKILIGKGPLCELRLTDPTVSRRHAALELTELGLMVTDLGSTNGTFVNDIRVTGAYLQGFDRLRVGS